MLDSKPLKFIYNYYWIPIFMLFMSYIMQLYVYQLQFIYNTFLIYHFQEHLSQHKVVFCQWRDNFLLQMILSSGIIINIQINLLNGDIMKIAFDKYLVGKLLSECVADGNNITI